MRDRSNVGTFTKLDLTGHRYGLLAVIEKAPKRGARYCWRCKCDCGGEKVATTTHLRNGHTKSCGCQYRTHNMTNTPEHKIWRGIKKRCLCPTDTGFKHYGARGITIADRWLGKDGFANFFADVGIRPSPDHSIDRIDNSNGYEPGNVRWVTRDVQANNKRSNRLLTHNGRIQTVTRWAREMGIGYTTITARLKTGWTISAALTTPVRGS